MDDHLHTTCRFDPSAGATMTAIPTGTDILNWLGEPTGPMRDPQMRLSAGKGSNLMVTCNDRGASAHMGQTATATTFRAVRVGGTKRA